MLNFVVFTSLCNKYKDIVEYCGQQQSKGGSSKIQFVDGKSNSYINALFSVDYLKGEFVQCLLQLSQKLTFLKEITRVFMTNAIEGADSCQIILDALN
jgi:hypothetical protein